MTSDTKWIIGTLGTLIIVSTMLLATFILSLTAGPRLLPASYDDGTSTFGSVSAGMVAVETPHGDRLTGTFSADEIGGVMSLADDVTGDRRSVEFDPMDMAVISVAEEMLLELNGWPRHRWPEGWAPE